MPSCYTHNKFSKDVLKTLDKETKQTIEKSKYIYEIFSQSFDNLFYYNFLSLRKGKAIRDLAHYAQNHYINDYFLNIMKYIIDNNLYNNTEVLCYLYGSLNHYALDSTMHPYIIYKTGDYNKNNKESKKYKGMHNKFERDLDAYNYEIDTNKEFKKYKIYNDLFKHTIFSNELKNAIDYTYENTFKVKNMGTIYNNSFNQGNLIYTLLVFDPYGIKQFFYKIVDFLTPLKKKKYQYFSFYTKPLDKKELNFDNKIWNNPCDKNITSTKSYDELYIDAINMSNHLINCCNEYLKNNLSEEELRTQLKDLSYGRGLPWKEKQRYRYFEY